VTLNQTPHEEPATQCYRFRRDNRFHAEAICPTHVNWWTGGVGAGRVGEVPTGDRAEAALRPLRFSVRRLMIVVLIMAALVAVFEADRRWERWDMAHRGTVRIIETRYAPTQ